MIARATIFLLLAMLLLPAQAAAQALVLSNFMVENHNGQAVVRFSLDLEDQQQLELLLKEGATLELHCTATLYRRREYWLDATISEAVYTARLQRDQLTQEFVLTSPGREGQLRDRDLDRLIATGLGSIEMSLGRFAELDRGTNYSVELDVDLTHLDVPAWMKNVLFFKSWEAAPRTVYQMEFAY